MRRADRAGKNGAVRADLTRILDLAEKLHGNQGNAKAVFACAAREFWREFDVPVRTVSSGTNLQMNSRFHLRPLARFCESLERTVVCLIDRSKARFFELQGETVTEQEPLIEEIRRTRSDGFEGFDAGHAERRVENDASNHFKRAGERLLERYGNGGCDHILIGCRDEMWPMIERQLHPYVKQRLAGHFVIDTATPSAEDVRQHAKRALEQHRTKYRHDLLSEVLDEARANNHGALGLRRVLRSLEQGEMQALLIGEGFSAEGVECDNCGHIDMRMVPSCAMCGQKTHDIDDICDALIGRALRSRAAVIHIPANPEFERAGNIGALLRFRADRSVGEMLA